MPAGTTSPQFAVWVNLQGQVNPSVLRSIGITNKALQALQTRAAAVNKTLSAVTKTIGAMAAVAGGLMAIGSITAGMEQAINLSKQNEQTQEAMLVLLQNERKLRGQNVNLAEKDLKAIVAQSEALEQQTGIYKNVFEQGAMIFAQTHRTQGEIKNLQYSMANLLVSQKMQGKSAEELTQIYTAVGKAIQTGMARNLNSVGVFLTAQEKNLLMFNAKVASFTGDYSANIKILEDAINRTYGGMAAKRKGTLLGQADIAMASMQESMERMGNALLPVQLRLQMIFTKLIPLAEPLVTRLAFLIDSVLKRHQTDLDEWVKMIETKVIPVMVDWINKGWAGIIKAFAWFKENSWWILPVLKGVAEGFAIIAAAIVVVTGAVTALAAAADPLTWLFGGAMGLGALREVWYPLKEWAMGQKKIDPKNLGYANPDVFKFKQKTTNLKHPEWGSALRAARVQTGWYDQLKDILQKWWDEQGWPMVQKWWKDMTDWWTSTGLPIFNNIVKVVTDYITPTVVAWFSKLMDLFSGEILKKFGIDPRPQGENYNSPLGDGRSTHEHIWGLNKNKAAIALGNVALDAARTATGHLLIGNPQYNIPADIAAPGRKMKITHYGYEPIYSPDWDYNSAHWIGAGRPLTHAYTGIAGSTTSVALMDRLAAKWGVKKGDTFTYVTPSGNKYVMVYEDRVPRGHKVHGKFVPYPEDRMDLFDPYGRYKGGIEPGGHIENIRHEGVTVNYNVTHHHHGDDQSQQVASVHRAHQDRLKKMIEENEYNSNREDFSGVYV